MKIEMIEWLDSNGRYRWSAKDEYLEFAKASLVTRSVGFVFYEADDRVALVQNVSAIDAFDGAIIIPKAAIMARIELYDSSH